MDSEYLTLQNLYRGHGRMGTQQSHFYQGEMFGRELILQTAQFYILLYPVLYPYLKIWYNCRILGFKKGGVHMNLLHMCKEIKVSMETYINLYSRPATGSKLTCNWHHLQ